MEALEAIRTRRSTRVFQDRLIEAATLDQVLEAGRLAPSGMNAQGNHFLVIQNKEILEKLGSLVQDAFARMEVTEDTYPSLRNSIQRSKQGNYVFYHQAPTLIVVANKKDYGNGQADVSVALTTMMIAANALDLGSCYINQLRWLSEDPTVLAYLQELGLAADERVYGSLSIGYAATPDGKPLRVIPTREGNKVTML